MTDAMTIENPTTARLIALSKQFPEIQAQQITDDTIRLSVADRESPIFVDYFCVDTVQNGNDAWRYFLSHQTDKTEHAGQFSHPTEKGCWIMAKKYFTENGCIEVPTGNTHLSEIDRDRMASAQIARDSRRKNLCLTPQIGDMVLDLQGNERRICSARLNACQLTTWMERDYYTDADGHAQSSGALGQSIEFADMAQTTETRRVLFWTFKDGRSGAGRRVEFWVNVTVWIFNGDLGQSMWGAAA